MGEGIIIAVVGAGAATIAAAISSMVTLAASRKTGEAAWQTSINDGFHKLTQDMENTNARLERTVQALSGEVNNLTQHVESLEAILRRRGLKIPKRPSPVNPLAGLMVIEGGKNG